MAASARVWLLAAVLACTLLLLRPADAGATEADAPGPGPEGSDACNPRLDKTCKPGDSKAAENQEEVGGFGGKLPSMPKLPLPLPGVGKVDRDGDGDIDEDDELPSFDTHMTILGH